MQTQGTSDVGICILLYQTALVERCLRLQRERVDKERLASTLAADLERARCFQQSLLPRQSIAASGWRLEGRLLSCEALAGDLYLAHAGDDGLVLAVSDVVGQGPSPEDLDPRGGMNLVPTRFAVGDVGSGDANAIADLRHGDLRSECRAGGRGIAGGWGVLADDLDHELAVAMNGVHQVQDRCVVRIECDMQIAVLSAVQRGDAAIDRRASGDDSQPVRTVDVAP
jgi:hypothetical protein